MNRKLKNSLIAGAIAATIAAGGVGIDQAVKNCLLDEVVLTMQDAKKCFKTEADYQRFKGVILAEVQKEIKNGDSLILYGEYGDDLLAIMTLESQRGAFILYPDDMGKTLNQLK
ncbi:hypothetical protein HY469_05285 [Candidatus Roizmanbacteria bacterium]|nr:hypothetical protein [Candidatus Roizmanbacteria bacterium]